MKLFIGRVFESGNQVPSGSVSRQSSRVEGRMGKNFQKKPFRVSEKSFQSTEI